MDGLQGMLGTSHSTELAKRFSAIQAVDDFFLSRDAQDDFLRMYLSRHFPDSIRQNDLDNLKLAIANVKGEVPTMEFRRGILYFFLALAETKLLISGDLQNAEVVSGDWNSSLNHFRRASSIGESMAEELSKILEQADVDKNKKLDINELKNIIESRI